MSINKYVTHSVSGASGLLSQPRMGVRKTRLFSSASFESADAITVPGLVLSVSTTQLINVIVPAPSAPKALPKLIPGY